MKRRVGAKVAAALLVALLATAWLGQAPLAYAQREDTPTDFSEEFLNALRAIFCKELRKNEGVDDATRYVLSKFDDHVDAVREFVYNMFKGVKGESEARELADEVVKLLLTERGRVFDYYVERYHAGENFEVFVEVKTSTKNFPYAVKEALQDAALARHPGKGQLIVWFFDPSVRGPEWGVLKNFLQERGIVVITDSEANRVVLTLHGAFASRYGQDLVNAMADLYGVPSDEAVRRKLMQALNDGSIFNFISEHATRGTEYLPRTRVRRLDEALRGFAEDANQAVKLRDFIKRNWGTLSLVGGFALKVAFEAYNRFNPPKTPEEERTRRIVGMAIDMTNLGIATLMDFENALVFVRSLRAAAQGGGAPATATAAAAGVALLMSVLSWYANWYVETHTTYKLCRIVGVYDICFNIERPSGLFETERLVITVDRVEVASFALVRGGHWDPPRGACLFEWPSHCVDKQVSFGPVSITCQSSTPPFVECTVEAESWSYPSETITYDYGYYVRRCVYVTQITYRWTWRVRVTVLGLEEVQAPLGWPVSYKWLGESCITKYFYPKSYTTPSYTPSTSSAPSGAPSWYWGHYEPEPI